MGLRRHQSVTNLSLHRWHFIGHLLTFLFGNVHICRTSTFFLSFPQTPNILDYFFALRASSFKPLRYHQRPRCIRYTLSLSRLFHLSTTSFRLNINLNMRHCNRCRRKFYSEQSFHTHCCNRNDHPYCVSCRLPFRNLDDLHCVSPPLTASLPT